MFDIVVRSKLDPLTVDCNDFEANNDYSLDHTSSESISQILYRGEIHLVYDDVYECPSLLIKLWDNAGSVLDKTMIKNVLQLPDTQIHIVATNNNNNNQQQQIDPRTYYFGELELVNHPLLGNYWYGNHLCEMSQYFELLLSSSTSSSSSVQSLNAAQQLVVFLSFAGRFFGIDINAHNFIELQTILNNST